MHPVAQPEFIFGGGSQENLQGGDQFRANIAQLWIVSI